jgi:predicted nucleic acid-binding protein
VPALCDVNVLPALVTDRHALHGLAVRWAESVPTGGAVLCRVAQTGLLRLLNNPAVMREEASLRAIAARRKARSPKRPWHGILFGWWSITLVPS